MASASSAVTSQGVFNEMNYSARSAACFACAESAAMSSAVALEPPITRPIELNLGVIPVALIYGNRRYVWPACVIRRVSDSSISIGSNGFLFSIIFHVRSYSFLLLFIPTLYLVHRSSHPCLFDSKRRRSWGNLHLAILSSHSGCRIQVAVDTVTRFLPPFFDSYRAASARSRTSS